MKRYLCLFLPLAILLSGCCGEQPPRQTLPPVPQPTAPAQTFAPVSEPVEPGVAVETVCGTIWFPLMWEEVVEVQTTPGDPMVLSFRALLGDHEPQSLFDLSFGSNLEDPVGTVRDGAGEIWQITVCVYEFSPDETWEDGQIQAFYAMQEELNGLLGQLPIEALAPDGELMTISAEPWELFYPAKWDPWLLIQGSAEEGWLDFCCVLPDRDPVLLFSLCFGGDGGQIIRELPDGTILNVFLAELTFSDGWSREERDTIYSMQEDLNILLEHITDHEGG